MTPFFKDPLRYKSACYIYSGITLILRLYELTLYLVFPDYDECNPANIHIPDCSPNAICLNLEATYNCTCIEGYTGDGINCVGKYLSYIIGVNFCRNRIFQFCALQTLIIGNLGTTNFLFPVPSLINIRFNGYEIQVLFIPIVVYLSY